MQENQIPEDFDELFDWLTIIQLLLIAFFVLVVGFVYW
jgi:hypothetical protein